MPTKTNEQGRACAEVKAGCGDAAFPWKVLGAELGGTALLVLIGVSVVILDFGQGSAVVALLPSASQRRLITGFLFGATGALIAISPLGEESGAHINPIVTLAFCLLGRLKPRYAAGYVISQFVGAAIGAAPLLIWGVMGRSVAFGATLPSLVAGDVAALEGEVLTSFALIFGLFALLSSARWKHFAPCLFPPLYAVMVWLERPISGTSTNPARSFGPALISGQWRGWWIYGLGPLIGALAAVVIHRVAGSRSKIAVAKIHHFNHDRYGVFRTET